MPKKALFDEDSEDDAVALKTENEYAKKYDKWREKEELHKLEQKYGSKPLNSDASSSDSEDESDEEPEISEEVEEQFLKTLALLKTKDPRIYDPSYKFFKQEEKAQEKKQEQKQLTFADSDEDDDDDGDIFKVEKVAPEPESTKDGRPSASGSSSKNIKESKIKDYLIGKTEHIDNTVEKDLAPLKALWSDPKLNEGEAFLRDYILNKRYLEEAEPGAAVEKIRDDEDLEEDEKRVEEQGKFERAYNFRFEEPDDEFLKRFPRTMNSIRPKDDRRARKRAEVRTRKEEEKQRKMEEIGRLKALKLKEIQEKIAKIKQVTGNEELAFKEQDIEGDFDPEEHDRRMRAIFDDEYYGEADDEKPIFPDLDEELEIENWDKYDPERDRETSQDDELNCEDEEFNMDADYDPKQAKANLIDQLTKSQTKKRRNRKKKSKLAKLLATEKPKFVPTVADKTYDEYMEEYYKMDCEDVIGDLPTRFKYRDVVPNDYGLTVEEILLADDKELTQWVPLKRIIKHREEAAERSDLAVYKRRAEDAQLKRKVLPSLFKDVPEEPEITVPLEQATQKKKKKKQNKQSVTETTEGTANPSEDIELNETQNNGPATQNEQPLDSADKAKIKKKKKKRKTSDAEVVETEQAVQEHAKVKKDKKKKEKQNGFQVVDINTSQEDELNTINIDHNDAASDKQKLKRKIDSSGTEIASKKKKKKHKKNANNDGDVTNKVTRNNAFTSNKGIKKFRPNEKLKKHDGGSENPLGKLSDGRLKAYGLNPKKYRSFLKYKKF